VRERELEREIFIGKGEMGGDRETAERTEREDRETEKMSE
jgi:hypothetical protein